MVVVVKGDIQQLGEGVTRSYNDFIEKLRACRLAFEELVFTRIAWIIDQHDNGFPGNVEAFSETTLVVLSVLSTVLGSASSFCSLLTFAVLELSK